MIMIDQNTWSQTTGEELWEASIAGTETEHDQEFGTEEAKFYETIVSAIFFFILFSVRKKIKTAGTMFGIYLMLNGFERFWIEKIRVNTVYNIGGFHPTQAEIISTLLFVAGFVIVFLSRKNKISVA